MMIHYYSVDSDNGAIEYNYHCQHYDKVIP